MLETVLIIDGNNLAFKSTLVPELSNDDGIETHVLYSLFQSIFSLLRDFKTRYFIFTWDVGHSKRRKLIYPEYKGNRKEHRERSTEEKQKWESFYRQLNMSRKIFTYLKIPQVFIPGFEADDLMSLLGNIYCKKYKTVIVSSDKDLLQCLNPNLQVYNPMQKKLWDYSLFSRQLDCKVTPDQYSFARAIMGDKGDNIDGIHGVGIKTALQIVQDIEHLTLDALKQLMRRNPYTKKKMSLKVIEGLDTIDRNLKLMLLPKVAADLNTNEKIEFLKAVNRELVQSIFKYKEVSSQGFSRLFLKLQFVHFLKNKEKNLEMLSIKLKNEGVF